MNNNLNQINKNENFNLLSHRRLINKTMNRLVSDSWNIILNSEKFNVRINEINNKLDINSRIYLAYDLYRIMRKYKFYDPIDIILLKFNITKEDLNKYTPNIKYWPYLSEINLKNLIENDDSLINIDDIINKWTNSEKVPKFDSEDHYLGTTPIKTRKSKIYFISKKVFKQNDNIPNVDWRKLIIDKNVLNKIFHDKSNKTLKGLSQNAFDKYVANNLKDKKHKFYTVIHINNKISTWKILLERKTNLIIQFENQKYDNDEFKYNKFSFGNKIYITNNKYINFNTFLESLKSFINEYKGFQIPGNIKYVRNEAFGYYICSETSIKSNLIIGGFKRIKFRRKNIKLNEDIIYENNMPAIGINEKDYIYTNLDSKFKETMKSILNDSELDIDNPENDIHT